MSFLSSSSLLPSLLSPFEHFHPYPFTHSTGDDNTDSGWGNSLAAGAAGGLVSGLIGLGAAGVIANASTQLARYPFHIIKCGIFVVHITTGF
jgi:hypothetical protein